MSESPQEGSPIWVICLVCGLVLSVAVIIEVVHYTKLYIAEKKTKKVESPMLKN
ncbi:hypothetical protein ENUP19_0083G0005 [Entamoeba nuttalli]|uniref:Uncharacterized protein n=1 Tax=Entamoeba nuttalli TaxID=412467 RepID=A0ABQ0DFK1_9EUKA